MIGAALFLRNPHKGEPQSPSISTSKTRHKDITIAQVIRDPRMLLFMGSLLLFFFCIQMVMIHLVSYATDSGISAR